MQLLAKERKVVADMSNFILSATQHATQLDAKLRALDCLRPS